MKEKYTIIDNGFKVFKVRSEKRSTITNIALGLFCLFGVFFLPEVFKYIYHLFKLPNVVVSMLGEITFIVLMFLIIVLGLFSLFGVFFLPKVFKYIYYLFKLPNVVVSMLGEITFIALMFLIYYEDLKFEAKKFKNNFKSCFKEGFKYYISGFLCMVFFNLIIALVLKNISQNEEGVRNLLYSSPIYAIINISIFAPLAEELSFRKTLSTIFKNKYIFALISGLLFGGAHLATNILNNTFVISDLLYLLPYGSLGFVFALMDNKTKTTFTSIFMHAMHNTITCILLLIVYSSGAM